MDSKKTGSSTNRPNLAIILIAIWALIQVVRITAYPLTQSVLAGQDADAWLYPAFVDIFIGVTAPFIAFFIWKKTGLGFWVTIITWFTISIFDHLDATTAALTTQIPKSLSMGSASGTVTFLLIMTALDIIALVTLTSAKMKSHYLKT